MWEQFILVQIYKQLNFEFLLSYDTFSCDFLCLFADAEQETLFTRFIVT